MKITMYELLGMIKDGKAPKKFKYDTHEWIYNYESSAYCNGKGLEFEDYMNDGLIKYLNDTVEILEEEKKIPGKLNLYYHINNDVEEETGETTFNDLCDIIGNLRKHEDTINSIIDYLKSKGE